MRGGDTVLHLPGELDPRNEPHIRENFLDVKKEMDKRHGQLQDGMGQLPLVLCGLEFCSQRGREQRDLSKSLQVQGSKFLSR